MCNFSALCILNKYGLAEWSYKVNIGLLTGIGDNMLTGGPGLMDPCEKEPIDAVASLTPQQREDITNSAQV